MINGIQANQGLREEMGYEDDENDVYGDESMSPSFGYQYPNEVKAQPIEMIKPSLRPPTAARIRDNSCDISAYIEQEEIKEESKEAMVYHDIPTDETPGYYK